MENEEAPVISLKSDVMRDCNGLPLLLCATCGQALCMNDLIEQSLRLPEPAESREDYVDAELLDDLAHVACLNASLSA